MHNFLLFSIQLRFTRAHAKVLGKIMPYSYTEAALLPVLKILQNLSWDSILYALWAGMAY